MRLIHLPISEIVKKFSSLTIFFKAGSLTMLSVAIERKFINIIDMSKFFEKKLIPPLDNISVERMFLMPKA
jgi:hypothetical protein